MDKVSIQLTVFFENPFWIGIFEKREYNQLSVSKIVFGSEPKDYEVYEWVLISYCKLKFSPAVVTAVTEARKKPKRKLRDVKKQMEKQSIGTKSQLAMKLQLEQVKTERKKMKIRNKKIEKQCQFDLKQKKRKAKHKGR